MCILKDYSLIDITLANIYNSILQAFVADNMTWVKLMAKSLVNEHFFFSFSIQFLRAFLGCKSTGYL